MQKISNAWDFTFSINNAPEDKNVDDVVQGTLARIGVFILEDSTDKFVVTTSDSAVTEEDILKVLNGRFQLNAQFLKKETRGGKDN